LPKLSPHNGRTPTHGYEARREAAMAAFAAKSWRRVAHTVRVPENPAPRSANSLRRGSRFWRMMRRSARHWTTASPDRDYPIIFWTSREV
jgi:hypothetical protein